MEALAGLSLAANIMQVIEFSHDTVSLFMNVYRNQTSDPNLAERVMKLELLGENLKSQLSQSATILNRSQRSLMNAQLPGLCADVVATAKELRLRLNVPATSKLKALKSTLKMKFSGELSKVADLDNKLRRLEQNLQTGLLSEIWSREDAAMFQQLQEFKTLDHDVRDLIQKYAQGQIDLQGIVRRDQSAAMMKLSNDLQAMLLDGLNRNTQQVTQAVQLAEERQSMRRQKNQLLTSVRFPVRNARRSAVGKAHDKTFQWIFDAPDDDAASSFRKWIVSDNDPVFWIQGKPGSGKSTLMKFLVCNRRTVELLDSKYSINTVYSHFIWMADESVDGTIRGMLCSLIHQILEVESNHNLVETLFQNHPHFKKQQSPNDWELDELQLVLEELLNLHHGFTVIFIDGLDELKPGEDKYGLTHFVKTVLSSTANLKICVSSRPEPDEKLLFRDLPSIELQKLTKHDLERVAGENLSKYFDFALREVSEKDRKDLVATIVDRAESVFLWITLALTRLRRGVIACDTVDQLIESLKQTPVQLNELYQKMWDRMGPEQKHYQKDASFVFRCLLNFNAVARGEDHLMGFHLTICRNAQSAPLFKELVDKRLNFYQSSEFLRACENNQRQVESHCAGLIEFVQSELVESAWAFEGQELFAKMGKNDPRILRINFIHRSLKDFLLEDGRWLLEQPDEEAVYAAIFRARLGELMITPGSEANPTLVSVFGSQLRAEDKFRYSLDTEVYATYRVMFYPKDSYWSLRKLLEHFRRWLHHAQYLHTKQKATTTMWDVLYHHNFKLLHQVFQTYGLSDFIEEIAIYLRIIDPNIGRSLPRHPLSTYLIWQSLGPAKMSYYGLYRCHKDRTSESRGDLSIFKTADMEWAYPHTIIAGDHAIPQLLALPEAVTTCDLYLKNEEVLFVLRHLKQLPNHWLLSSVLLADDLGGCLSTECDVHFIEVEVGVVDSVQWHEGTRLPNGYKWHDREPHQEYYEVIFRANAATLLNRYISRALASNCVYHANSWTLSQQIELRTLLCAQSEEKIEILLVGHSRRLFDDESGPITVFDPTKFEHLSLLAANRLEMLKAYKDLFKKRNPQYFAPSKSQSDAISVHVDPDLLMKNCVGPYDACLCVDCTDEKLLDAESREKLTNLKRRRKDRVNAIKEIIAEVSLDKNKRVYNILDHLRLQGQYIPTEDDLVEFLEVESTAGRIAVLERLNREKKEKEAWMKEDAGDCETVRTEQV